MSRFTRPRGTENAMAPDVMEYRGGTVFSKRKEKAEPTMRQVQEMERKNKARKEREKFSTDPPFVWKQNPEDRLQWLLRALLLLGKKTVEAKDLHEIITNEEFVRGVPFNVGVQMRGAVVANLHVFASKYQKDLEKQMKSSYGLGAFAPGSEDNLRISDRADANKRPRRGSSSDHDDGANYNHRYGALRRSRDDSRRDGRRDDSSRDDYRREGPRGQCRSRSHGDGGRRDEYRRDGASRADSRRADVRRGETRMDETRRDSRRDESRRGDVNKNSRDVHRGNSSRSDAPKEDAPKEEDEESVVDDRGPEDLFNDSDE